MADHFITFPKRSHLPISNTQAREVLEALQFSPDPINAKSKTTKQQLPRTAQTKFPTLAKARLSKTPQKQSNTDNSSTSIRTFNKNFKELSSSTISSPNIFIRKFPPRFKYQLEKSQIPQVETQISKFTKDDLDLIQKFDPIQIRAQIEYIKSSIMNQDMKSKSILKNHEKKLSWKWETPKSESSKTVRFKIED